MSGNVSGLVVPKADMGRNGMRHGAFYSTCYCKKGPYTTVRTISKGSPASWTDKSLQTGACYCAKKIKALGKVSDKQARRPSGEKIVGTKVKY